MFGYLTADVLSMSKENRKLYRSFYCGLCEKLSSKYGNTARFTLSYDLTFVGMILSDVYNCDINYSKKHCPIHPLTKIEVRNNEYFDFAADMNILMTYYKCLDDVNDDNSLKAQKKANKLLPFVNAIKKTYPEKCQIIEQCLNEISDMEKANVLNPDLPANCFGKVMSELFYIKEDEYSETLKSFGFHLGRYIYLVDAICDLKKDLKTNSYNPLVAIENLDSDQMLEMVLEEANYFYKQLKLDNFNVILDNIMYTGLWSSYDRHKTLERKAKK